MCFIAVCELAIDCTVDHRYSTLLCRLRFSCDVTKRFEENMRFVFIQLLHSIVSVFYHMTGFYSLYKQILIIKPGAWFLRIARIASVYECLYVCVCVCMCVCPEAINN